VPNSLHHNGKSECNKEILRKIFNRVKRNKISPGKIEIAVQAKANQDQVLGIFREASSRLYLYRVSRKYRKKNEIKKVCRQLQEKIQVFFEEKVEINRGAVFLRVKKNINP
jgi:protein involved in sex pheromone biosynthesis